MANIPLSARTQFVFDMLCRIAEVSGPTPTNAQIQEKLAAEGFQIHARRGDRTYTDVTNYELARLTRHGLIAVIGAQQKRVFEIVATGQRTSIRPKVARVVVRTGICTDAMAVAHARLKEQAAGWPKVTAESAAPYDRAVKRKLFGRPEHQSGETPDTIRQVRPAYGTRSLTGCSMEAA